jgi:aminoglycoside phosphotransferase (APT) family kinase protein
MSDPVNELAERLARVLRTRIEGLVRLSGGASRETWAFDSVTPDGGRKELILRRDPPYAPRVVVDAGDGATPDSGMELEARLLSAAARAGVPVPAVRAAGPPASDRLETSYLVMDRVGGQTIARKILRDPEFGVARAQLAGHCGAALAKLHSIDPASVRGLARTDPLTRYRTLYQDLSAALSYRSAVFEWAFEWLVANAPQGRPTCVVHGDFRLGNLIVDQHGLASVLDWELAHIGDPMEDLGWLCVKAWRFGAAGEVAGVGSIDDLVSAYNAAGGTADRDALNWWIVCGTLTWGVMCMMQANAHLSGSVQSVELAAIGRRVAEQEHDLLLLLAPDELHKAKSAYEPGSAAPLSDEFGLPSAHALLLAVQRFIEHDVMGATTGRVQFHSRVAANAIGIVARQLAAQPLGVQPPDSQRLAATGGAADGASGPADVAAMAAATVARVAVSNPAYLG